MSGYGRVISGGKQAQKGNNTKQINDKLDGFSDKHEKSEKIAGAVRANIEGVVWKEGVCLSEGTP